MRIAVDLDGVLYEWDKTARYMLRNLRGCDHPGLLLESMDWHYIQRLVEPEDWDWLWREGLTRGLFRHGHVTTGGMTGVRTLKEQGHTLIVATQRPPEAMRDTLSWLDHHFGSEDPYPWSGIHLLSGGEAKTVVDAELLIDDKPSNLAAWARAGRDGILFGRRWNEGWQSTDHIQRVESWKEVPLWISTL